MTKLSLDALKQRAEAIASEDLLATISGGTENSCHDTTPSIPRPPMEDEKPLEREKDKIPTWPLIKF